MAHQTRLQARKPVTFRGVRHTTAAGEGSSPCGREVSASIVSPRGAVQEEAQPWKQHGKRGWRAGGAGLARERRTGKGDKSFEYLKVAEEMEIRSIFCAFVV